MVYIFAIEIGRVLINMMCIASRNLRDSHLFAVIRSENSAQHKLVSDFD